MKIRITKIQIKKYSYLIIITALLFFGFLIAYNSMGLSNINNLNLLCVFIASITGWILFHSNKLLKEMIAYYILCIISILIIINTIIRGETDLLIAGVTSLLSFIILKKFVPNNFDYLYPLISAAMIISSLVSIIRFSVLSSNTHGILLCFGGIMLLNFLCLRKIKSAFLFFSCVGIFIILLSITRSRASILSFIIVVILSYKYLFLRNLNLKNCLLLICIIFIIFLMSNSLISFFNAVFFQKWGNLDLTSNRINLWSQVFKDISLFGNGINHLGRGDAHNSFIQLLGCSGLIVFVLFVFLICRILYIISKVNNNIVYLNFLCSWICMSMFENLDIFTSRMVPITILFLFHFFLLLGEQKESVVRCHNE